MKFRAGRIKNEETKQELIIKVHPNVFKKLDEEEGKEIDRDQIESVVMSVYSYLIDPQQKEFAIYSKWFHVLFLIKKEREIGGKILVTVYDVLKQPLYIQQGSITDLVQNWRLEYFDDDIDPQKIDEFNQLFDEKMRKQKIKWDDK